MTTVYPSASLRACRKHGEGVDIDNTYYLFGDHASTMPKACPELAEGISFTSIAVTANSRGVRQTELRYFAYGGTRYDAGSQTCPEHGRRMTLYRYTGQRVESGTGLYDYGARWYDLPSAGSWRQTASFPTSAHPNRSTGTPM
jgi:hypothetical protein